MQTEKIRNVALVGHQGSGKTTLAETMLLCAGAVRRRGTVAEGTTASDYHPDEVERKMSIYTSLLHADFEGKKFNVLDTPGYPDFAGEVLAALRAADAALFVMNANEGVQVGTELAWRYAAEMEKPSMFVVNHLDREETSFRDLARQIQERFGRGATVVQIPSKKAGQNPALVWRPVNADVRNKVVAYATAREAKVQEALASVPSFD